MDNLLYISNIGIKQWQYRQTATQGTWPRWRPRRRKEQQGSVSCARRKLARKGKGDCAVHRNHHDFVDYSIGIICWKPLIKILFCTLACTSIFLVVPLCFNCPTSFSRPASIQWVSGSRLGRLIARVALLSAGVDRKWCEGVTKLLSACQQLASKYNKICYLSIKNNLRNVFRKYWR